MRQLAGSRPTEPAERRRRIGWFARAGDAVLGKGSARRSVVMTLSTLPFYLAWSLLYVVYLVPRQLMSREDAQILLGLNAGSLLFYPCVRAAGAMGRQLRMLGGLQVAYGMCVSLVDYLFIASARPAALTLVSCAFIASAIALKPRAVVVVGLCACGALGALLCVLHTTQAFGYDGARDGLGLVFSIVTLCALTEIGRLHSAARERVWTQKRQLHAVLGDIERLATHDPLTGLFNRRHAETLLREATADDGAYTIALIDLDDFKRINDRWGHAVGDDALRAFAGAVRALLRATDVVARWGGEEFLLLMPHGTGSGGSGAAGAIDRLRQALAHAEVSTAAPGLRIGFSAGLAEHANATGWERTLDLADRALYAAKAAGKGCCIRSPSLVAAATADAAS